MNEQGMKLEWWTSLEDDGKRYFLNGIIDIYGRKFLPPGEDETASDASFLTRYHQVRVCFELGYP